MTRAGGARPEQWLIYNRVGRDLAGRIPPATRPLAVAAQQPVFLWRGEAYANAPATDINADKLREPTYIRLTSDGTLSLSPSFSHSLHSGTGMEIPSLSPASWRYESSFSLTLTRYWWRRGRGYGCSGGGTAHSLHTPHDTRRWRATTFACHGGQQHGRGVHLITAQMLRLLPRLPRSSAAVRTTNHDTGNRALFEYRDAVYVILATYIGARYNKNSTSPPNFKEIKTILLYLLCDKENDSKIGKFWISNISKSNRMILMKIHIHISILHTKFSINLQLIYRGVLQKLRYLKKVKKNFNLHYLWILWTNDFTQIIRPRTIQNLPLQGTSKRLSQFYSRYRWIYKTHFFIFQFFS